MPQTPHLRFPLRLNPDGRFVASEQDSLQEVQDSVGVLLRTPLGARLLAPDVGVPDPTFTTGVNPVALEQALTDPETGDPRAAVTVIARPVDQDGQQLVRVRVTLAATQELA